MGHDPFGRPKYLNDAISQIIPELFSRDFNSPLVLKPARAREK
jgi:hypothetical protein